MRINPNYISNYSQNESGTSINNHNINSNIIASSNINHSIQNSLNSQQYNNPINTNKSLPNNSDKYNLVNNQLNYSISNTQVNNGNLSNLDLSNQQANIGTSTTSQQKYLHQFYSSSQQPPVQQFQHQPPMQFQQEQYQQSQRQTANARSDHSNFVTSLTKPVQSRVDPSQIPRPIFGNITEKECHIFESDKYVFPPNSLVEPHSMIIDRGNATSKYYKLTLNQIPSQHSILQSMKLPCAVIIQPFPLLNEFEKPVPIVNSSSNVEPIRCIRCRAYANPFTCISPNGNQCLCNFCGQTFDIPIDYLRLLQLQTKSQNYGVNDDDQINYPEIYHGVVDYYAPASLGISTNPELPCYCFVIEASSLAMQNNITNLVLYCLKHIFMQLKETSPETDIILILYSRELILFPFQNNDDNSKIPIKMCIISDVMEPFIPCPLSELCIPVSKGLEFLSELIDRIPDLIQSHITPHNAYFSAISLATQIFKTKNCTGSIFTFIASVPNTGIASINTKDTNIAPKSPPRKTSKNMKPSLGFVSGYIVHNIQQLDSIVESCRSSNVSVETFIITQISNDINPISFSNTNMVPTSTLAYLPQHTGGKLRLFSEFSFEKIYRDIYQTLYSIFFIQNIAYDCTFKLRCSKGIAISKIYAPWTAGGPTPDLSAFQIPKIDCNTAIAFLLRHEENLEQKKNVFLQAACLYTSKDKRQRLLRVLTISIPVTTSITTAFRYASIEPIINIYARMAAHHVISKGQRGVSNTTQTTQLVPGLPFSTNKSPSAVLTLWKQETLNSIIDMLFSYREHCANTSSTGQLILPDSLKLTLIYVSSLFKCPSLMPLNTVLEFSISEQLVGLYELLYSSVSYTTALLYPRLYPIHHSVISETSEIQKLDTVGLPYQVLIQDENNNINSDSVALSRFWISNSIACSGERILSDGIYILENGREIYLYIGPQVDSMIIKELFGVESLTDDNFCQLEVNTEVELDAGNMNVAKRVSNVIQQIRSDRFSISSYMPIVLVSAISQKAEAKFKALLVEDAYGFESTYVDFLCNVHKLVQSKLVES